MFAPQPIKFLFVCPPCTYTVVVVVVVVVVGASVVHGAQVTGAGHVGQVHWHGWGVGHAGHVAQGIPVVHAGQAGHEPLVGHGVDSGQDGQEPHVPAMRKRVKKKPTQANHQDPRSLPSLVSMSVYRAEWGSSSPQVTDGGQVGGSGQDGQAGGGGQVAGVTVVVTVDVHDATGTVLVGSADTMPSTCR